jgi:hypothetical protein
MQPNLGLKLERKRELRRHRRRRRDKAYIRMVLVETGCESVHSIELAQFMAFVNKVVEILA